MLYKHFFCVGW
uniref:Uncharacterized protein n=1 Tax=Anguilla anguilla TaxID=7936 RepID=A0A0E9XQU0_ANGAN